MSYTERAESWAFCSSSTTGPEAGIGSLYLASSVGVQRRHIKTESVNSQHARAPPPPPVRHSLAFELYVGRSVGRAVRHAFVFVVRLSRHPNVLFGNMSTSVAFSNVCSSSMLVRHDRSRESKRNGDGREREGREEKEREIIGNCDAMLVTLSPLPPSLPPSSPPEGRESKSGVPRGTNINVRWEISTLGASPSPLGSQHFLHNSALFGKG